MGLLGSVGGSVAAGDAAEHHEVAHGIAADAVAAVHTAGGLTGCVQAGDDAAVGVQHLCVGVDLQAAHGVVDARCDLDGVVGSGGQVVVHAVAAAELGVLTGCHRGVPGVHGLHKVGGSAVVGQDLGGLGVQQDLHAQLFGLSYRVLRRDRMYAVFGKGHPLEQAAAREGSFAWEWLEGQTLLLQNQTQRQGQYILQELRSRRLHPAEILESSNIRAAAALAASGYGIGFLSGELLEHLNNAVPFNAFPLRDCTLPLESVAAWRAGNYLPRYALAFIERMEQLENQKYNNSATKAH